MDTPFPRLLFVFVLALATLAVTLASPAPARAADGSDFNAGFLISDAQFFDGTAMSAAQVDQFIESRNPGCAAGRTCLENYQENVTAKSANSRCKAIGASSKRSAGQIIVAVSGACGISPAAILVILQKEQSLVTSSAPSSRAFQYAMGAGCPDTAPCDGNYAGFFDQVYYGAYLLKGYTIPGSTHYGRYAAGEYSDILYSPSKSCGTKRVFVANQATHALYVYTPYTPNQAALDNLYRTGDACSAYGNRNFWRQYTDWFGTTGARSATAIETKYASTGGESGPLGERDGALVTVGGSAPGVYQRFDHGVVAWSEDYGARVIEEPLSTRWISTGAAKIGWPKSETRSSNASGGGTYQHFDGGILTNTDANGTILVPYGQWKANGGPKAPFGWPTTEATYDTTLKLNRQEFMGGTAFDDGTHWALVGPQFVDYAITHGVGTGDLGWARTEVRSSNASGGGTYQHFDGGILTNTDANGTILVPYGQWKANGGPKAPFGWPTTEATYDTTLKLNRQEFMGGTAFDDGTHWALVGPQFVDYAASNGVGMGDLGWTQFKPQTNSAWGGGTYQHFDGGVLTNTDTYGTILVPLDTWEAHDGVNGVFGWPITEVITDSVTGLTHQDFMT
jgi:hypothetical protein